MRVSSYQDALFFLQLGACWMELRSWIKGELSRGGGEFDVTGGNEWDEVDKGLGYNSDTRLTWILYWPLKFYHACQQENLRLQLLSASFSCRRFWNRMRFL